MLSEIGRCRFYLPLLRGICGRLLDLALHYLPAPAPLVDVLGPYLPLRVSLRARILGEDNLHAGLTRQTQGLPYRRDRTFGVGADELAALLDQGVLHVHHDRGRAGHELLLRLPKRPMVYRSRWIPAGEIRSIASL
jgi:hypothetical protein